MSDPPYLGDNRYALLAEAPRAKKKRSNQNISEIFPELPVIQKPDPKYVVISATSGDKTLQEYSCFSVYRSLKLICSDILSVSELRDGNLLLLIGNKYSAEKLISSKNLPGICNIKCDYHGNLNFSKGTIYAPYLNRVPEAEIVTELKSQGVVEVYKYLRKNTEEKLAPCGVILLTFDRYHTPEKLEISWHKVKVRPYFPNPMRCKSCQKLGHTKKWCKNSPLCENCALPPHQPDICTRTYCINCTEEHPSTSKECKVFKQQKEILKIKTKDKCSLKTAKEKYQAQLSSPQPFIQSYSDITTNKTLNKPTFTTTNNIKPTTNRSSTTEVKKQTNPTTTNLSQQNVTESANTSSTNSIVINKTTTQETKLQKPTTSSSLKTTIMTRSMTKATTNSPTRTNKTKKYKETLNLTQNNNINVPKSSTKYQHTSYDEQEQIMFVDEEE